MTPIGNPQNIYIFSISELSLTDFILIMLPYSAVTLAVLLIFLMLVKNSPVQTASEKRAKVNIKDSVFFSLLFIISVLAVFGIVNYILCFVFVLAALLVFHRKTILKIDYSLLLTFVGFFIFVGNTGNIPLIKELIEKMLLGKEVVFSALISQVISNVPAALLLGGFTDNMRDLLIGVNIGGLGTLIASMASLISYKYVAVNMPDKKGRYIILFSIINFALLILMLLINLLI